MRCHLLPPPPAGSPAHSRKSAKIDPSSHAAVSPAGCFGWKGRATSEPPNPTQDTDRGVGRTPPSLTSMPNGGSKRKKHVPSGNLGMKQEKGPDMPTCYSGPPINRRDSNTCRVEIYELLSIWGVYILYNQLIIYSKPTGDATRTPVHCSKQRAGSADDAALLNEIIIQGCDHASSGAGEASQVPTVPSSVRLGESRHPEAQRSRVRVQGKECQGDCARHTTFIVCYQYLPHFSELAPT